VFVARPPASQPPQHDLRLVRAERRTFTGPAEFLGDPGNRARIAEYLTDMARAYAQTIPADLFGAPPSAELGHSYGEMAQALIESVVTADEPVDLLILAFSMHDLRPGRQTAAYLSHITAGAPMAFAICDQGSAAAFSALRIAGEYASSTEIRRTLLIAVEQAGIPYACSAPLPSQHRGVAMLYGDCAMPQARVRGVRQHPGVPSVDVASSAAADLADLAAGYDEVGLVLNDALAALWTAPDAGRVRVVPPGRPFTGVWWGLIDELSSEGRPDVLVAADYDPELRCLCLTAFDTRGSS
jgi:4-hydroxymandelate oxidase